VTYPQRKLFRRIAILSVLSLPIALPQAAFPQAMTAEQRKALQEQKKAEAEARRAAQLQKRKEQEEERLAKAELQKAIQPKDYDFAEQKVKFRSVHGWRESTSGGNTDGQFVALELVPTVAVKSPEGPPATLPRYTIQAIALPARTTLEDFVDYTNKSLASDPDLNISPPKETTIGDDGTKAYTVVARTKSAPGRQPVTIRRIIAARGDKGFVFQLISPTQLYARALAGVEQMEKTLAFGAGAATQPIAEGAPDADSILSILPEGALVFRRPKTWTHRDDVMAPGLVGAFYLDATANAPGNLAEQLMFIVDDDLKPTDTDARSYLARLLKANLAAQPNAQQSKIQDRLIDGKASASATASFESNGFKQKQLFVAAFRGSDAMNVVYIADESEFDKNLPDIQKAIDSIKWKADGKAEAPDHQ
jgi:hypothetical protein